MNADEYFDHWEKVHRDLMRAVALLEDDDLRFRPAQGYPRSIGDILRHMIAVEQGWLHYVILRELPAWPDPEQMGLGDADSLREALEETHRQTQAYLATVPVDDFNRIVQVPGDGTPKLGWILWHVMEQKIHHRGELYLCLSLLGKERPLTDRPG